VLDSLRDDRHPQTLNRGDDKPPGSVCRGPPAFLAGGPRRDVRQEGDLGVIPGSMGTKSYIVRGRGNPMSYDSCSHGAGRRMSRARARREVTVEAFAEARAGRVWQHASAPELGDERPQAYKDRDQ